VVLYEEGNDSFRRRRVRLDVPIDEPGFFEFMKEIDGLLSGEIPEECQT
jgi:hypothetical protein